MTKAQKIKKIKELSNKELISWIGVQVERKGIFDEDLELMEAEALERMENKLVLNN